MQIRSTLTEMTPYVAGERRKGALKLASNENPLGPSPRAMDAVHRAIEEAHIYPDGALTELRHAIADARKVSPDMIIPGNGSDEVLTMIAGTYLNPGDRVLIGAHTFSQYAFAARLFDTRIERVEMPDLRLTPERIIAAVEKDRDNPPKAIFLCTPNNPTGIALKETELEQLLAEIPRETLIVIDHAYQDYASSAAADATGRVLEYPNLIVLHTFSKIYGLAAVRVGYGVAAPERITEIDRVRLPFNVNGLGQTAAIAALEDTEFVQRSLEINRNGKQRMERLFTELGFEWIPTEANFMCVAVQGDAREAAEIIAEEGVTVRPLNSFGLPQHIRITIGTDHQIDVLEKGLRALAGQRAVTQG